MFKTNRRKPKAKPKKRMWMVTEDDAVTWCPECRNFTIVKLPDWMVRSLADGTTLLCHPGLGGCNTGFERSATSEARKSPPTGS